jgi:hypothetical protein
MCAQSQSGLYIPVGSLCPINYRVQREHAFVVLKAYFDGGNKADSTRYDVLTLAMVCHVDETGNRLNEGGVSTVVSWLVNAIATPLANHPSAQRVHLQSVAIPSLPCCLRSQLGDWRHDDIQDWSGKYSLMKEKIRRS